MMYFSESIGFRLLSILLPLPAFGFIGLMPIPDEYEGIRYLFLIVIFIMYAYVNIDTQRTYVIDDTGVTITYMHIYRKKCTWECFATIGYVTLRYASSSTTNYIILSKKPLEYPIKHKSITWYSQRFWRYYTMECDVLKFKKFKEFVPDQSIVIDINKKSPSYQKSPPLREPNQ